MSLMKNYAYYSRLALITLLLPTAGNKYSSADTVQSNSDVSQAEKGSAVEVLQRPNILLILADDLRWDTLGFMGDPVIQTPHIDNMAKHSLVFQNAFVTTSICAVSRASVLTGQYARQHGVHDFVTPLPSFGQTYPAILREQGYVTGFIGKWGVDANRTEYVQQCAQKFDYWAGEEMQTSYWHERNCRYVTHDGFTDRDHYHCNCAKAVWKAQGPDAKGGPHPLLADPVHLETEVIPDKVRNFLSGRDKSKPFCLSISLKAPHGPFSGYASKFANRFESVAMPKQASVNLAEAARQPDFLRQTLEANRGLRLTQDDRLASERQRLFRQYYRLVEGIDQCVGALIVELQQQGVAENTVIVFTSDNGHLHGEHGFFGKWLMYEESIRVPLVIHDPRTPQKKNITEALALNIDIAPTLLDLAGVEVLSAMQGNSLLPLIDDPDLSLRDVFFYEHLYEHAPHAPLHIEPCEGVRTAEWKYIHYFRQPARQNEQLFQLTTDPLETKNLLTETSVSDVLEQMRDHFQRMRVSLGPHVSWTAKHNPASEN